MIRRSIVIGIFVLSLCTVGWAQQEEECETHRLGVGAHYWTAIDEINTNDIDEHGFGWLLSYQYVMASLFKLEGDIEVVPDGYAGSDEWVISPQLMAIIGGGIYGGVGVGIHFSDGEFGDAPYYAFRVGLDLELIPSIHFDLNANYRFEEWDFEQIEDDMNIDTVTLGLTVRVAF